MIRCRLRVVRANAEEAQRRKMTYRTISQETGLAVDTITRLMRNEFDRIDTRTLNTLCNYFRCQPGDIFVHEPDEPGA